MFHSQSNHQDEIGDKKKQADAGDPLCLSSHAERLHFS
jgi:hypothetical protein